MCTSLEAYHSTLPLWIIVPFVMPLACMVSGQCGLGSSSLGMRGASVSYGRSGHFPAVGALFLHPVGVTGPCCLHTRPHGAIRRDAVLSCIGIACISGYTVALFLVVLSGRLALTVPWLPSDALALLFQFTEIRVVAVGMPPGFAMCTPHLYGSARLYAAINPFIISTGFG